MPSHPNRINPRTHRAQQLGKFGEDFAELFLLSIGYEIVERNWRGAHGEIDLIAYANSNSGSDQSEYIFVEVKARSSLQYGAPIEAITPEKYRRLFLLGREWISTNQPRSLWRIDIVTILRGTDGITLSHHKSLSA